MLSASTRETAVRESRAVVDVGVLLSHRVPKPHGLARPTGVPTKAALDPCPAHGLAVAVPAATARSAQVLTMLFKGNEDSEARQE